MNIQELIKKYEALKGEWIIPMTDKILDEFIQDLQSLQSSEVDVEKTYEQGYKDGHRDTLKDIVDYGLSTSKVK